MGSIGRTASRHSAGLATTAIALVIVAPLLAPGFTLAYDMVFVPHPHFTSSLIGLSGEYPRTVPTQAAVAALSALVGGALVQKAVLLAIFVLAGLGAARLTPARQGVGRVGAGVLYAWNPMTYERLVLGQWSLLLGYAVLPWAVSAAFSWRARKPGSTGRLVLSFAALTVASPYFGILGGAVTLMVALWPGSPAERGVPRRREWALVLGGFLAVNLVWMIPALLHSGGPDRPALAVELFRARSDSPLGTVGSLVSLGGTWRADLAPPGRTTVAWIPAFVIMAGLAVAGWRGLRRAWPAGARRALVAAAAIGLVLAAAPWFPPTAGLMRWVGGTFSGAGFLRDSQKFIAPWVLLFAVAFGLGVDRIELAVPRRERLTRGVVMLAPLLPLALAPTLAWGAGGRLHTTPYPDSWERVERIVADDPSPGALLALPWHAYLSFGWNDGAVVHQPARWYFSRRVVAASALEVNGHVLPGEDPWARLVAGEAGATGALSPRLRELGIRYVLVFRVADATSSAARFADMRPVLRSPDLALYRLGPVTAVPSFDTPAAPAVIAGDVIALAVVTAASVAAVRSRRRRRTSGVETPVDGAAEPPERARPDGADAPGVPGEAAVMLRSSNPDTGAQSP